MKVAYFPLQAHCFAFGGFEIQMLSAFNAVKQYDVGDLEVCLIDYWDRHAEFDIAHFWGLDIANFNNVYWAKKEGKAVVMTALLGYTESPITKLKSKISRNYGNGKIIFQILKSLDALVVVNESQKIKAVNYYGLSENKVFVIPNIVDDKYFEFKNELWESPFKNYLLCTGNVCPRKNQLNLVKSCIATNTNLIIIGKALTGESEYCRQIEDLIKVNDNIMWIKGLTENSDELFNFISHATCFALVSYEENQPISLLEAAACQIPLIVSNREFANQDYFENAYKVDPASIDEIAIAITTVRKRPEPYIVSKTILHNFTKLSVGQKYTNLYKKCTSAINRV